MVGRKYKFLSQSVKSTLKRLQTVKQAKVSKNKEKKPNGKAAVKS